jgi:hypothetical protein
MASKKLLSGNIYGIYRGKAIKIDNGRLELGLNRRLAGNERRYLINKRKAKKSSPIVV